jgi:hypothetical protein
MERVSILQRVRCDRRCQAIRAVKNNLPSGEIERVATRRVVFMHSFTLGAEPEIFPAGIYDVETTERTLDIAGLTARLRTSTVLIVPTRAGFRWCDVLASDLDDALIRDASQTAPRGDGEGPDPGHQGQN